MIDEFFADLAIKLGCTYNMNERSFSIHFENGLKKIYYIKYLVQELDTFSYSPDKEDKE